MSLRLHPSCEKRNVENGAGRCAFLLVIVIVIIIACSGYWIRRSCAEAITITRKITITKTRRVGKQPGTEGGQGTFARRRSARPVTPVPRGAGQALPGRSPCRGIRAAQGPVPGQISFEITQAWPVQSLVKVYFRDDD